MRPEMYLRGWLDSAINTYINLDESVSELRRAEMRAEAITLIWVLDNSLDYFAAERAFDDMIASRQEAPDEPD